MIVLVIAAGGAFSQVLRDGGVAQYVARLASGLRADPLLLGFGVAALLRLAVGSRLYILHRHICITSQTPHRNHVRPRESTLQPQGDSTEISPLKRKYTRKLTLGSSQQSNSTDRQQRRAKMSRPSARS